MCGRFTRLYRWKQLHRLMTLSTPPLEFRERYNVSPTQDVEIVRSDEHGPHALAPMRWGLVPHWADDPKIGASMINARSEGIDTKPAFRSALKRRRCIVPVSGFYEWKKSPDGKSKQPYYIRAAGDDDVLMLAGLWESWGGGEGRSLVRTFTIITTTPNRLMAGLHDRMPVVLSPPDWDRWLDPKNEDAAGVLPLLKPCADDTLVRWPVSTQVNSPRNDAPELIGPVKSELSGGLFD